MELMSIIVPCYNEENSLPFFYAEIVKATNEMDVLNFEFIFVDDGSNDHTLEKIKEISNNDSRVKFISFSRNFGKEAAIYAGLEKCKGDYAVLMDADLQDPPRLLSIMFNLVKNEGFDSVATRRVTRKGEPLIRSFCARCFYKLINKISKTEFVDGARDYRLMSRQMVNSLLQLSERNRFTKGLFGWVGFKTKWIEYENIERVAGETKWSFWGLFKYSIEGIVAFSTIPLYISSIVGFLICIISFIGIAIVFLRYFMGIDSAFGWSSMVTIFLFVSGIQLFCIGILGQYLAKTYIEVKNRPIYIAKEENVN